jgi:hypothetical protein
MLLKEFPWANLPKVPNLRKVPEVGALPSPLLLQEIDEDGSTECSSHNTNGDF